jgi:hypothetical protein
LLSDPLSAGDGAVLGRSAVKPVAASSCTVAPAAPCRMRASAGATPVMTPAAFAV